PRTRKTAEVFPNPITNGIVQFTVPNNDSKSTLTSRVNVEVQDQSGRLVSGGVVSINTIGNGQLDISDLPAGIYSFKIYVGTKVFINKIVKQ
ncbi:MAG: Secretion system C-terminal sorting domain, partial [Bacteroidota bacterium]